ncbi:MAG: hypothetical protein ACI9RV_002257, partial [Glaciecola sp.]
NNRLLIDKAAFTCALPYEGIHNRESVEY